KSPGRKIESKGICFPQPRRAFARPTIVSLRAAAVQREPPRPLGLRRSKRKTEVHAKAIDAAAEAIASADLHVIEKGHVGNAERRRRSERKADLVLAAHLEGSASGASELQLGREVVVDEEQARLGLEVPKLEAEAMARGNAR